MKTIKIILAFIFIFPLALKAQEILDLYQIVPNSKKSDIKESFNERAGFFSGVTKPTLEMYLPDKDKATGAAVVICPGGSYTVSYTHLRAHETRHDLVC